MYNVSKNISFVPLRNRIHGVFVIIQFMVVVSQHNIDNIID